MHLINYIYTSLLIHDPIRALEKYNTYNFVLRLCQGVRPSNTIVQNLQEKVKLKKDIHTFSKTLYWRNTLH